MRVRKEEAPAAGSPAWMATFADMMTLLLTFFILLFSMSSVDMEKYKAFASAFSGGAGVFKGEMIEGGGILIGDGMTQLPGIENSVLDGQEEREKAKRLHGMEEEIQEYLEQNNMADKVETVNNGDYITIRFDDILLFDLGKARLKPESIDVLRKIGVLLEEYLEDANVKLAFEGHTDNAPINTVQFPSNWELSAARAIAVAKFFIEELDFNPKQISTEGFGEYVPIEPNDTAEGRATNRRVEIKIINEPNR